MWIMILMTSYFGTAGNSAGAASIGITSVEFSSRERCMTAVEFSKKQDKIYHAFCVQK